MLIWGESFFFFPLPSVSYIWRLLTFQDSETGRAHPSSKSENLHILAFLVSLQERTRAHELASESQLSHTRQNEKPKIEKRGHCMAVVVGGCKATTFSVLKWLCLRWHHQVRGSFSLSGLLSGMIVAVVSGC